MNHRSPTTLLLVTGDPSILRGLRMRLALEPDLAIVGEACCRDDVAVIADRLAPDLAIVDVDLPEARTGGLALVASLAAHHPVIAIGLEDDPAAAARIRAAGAADYVGKHEADPRLLNAIRACREARGGDPMS